MKTPRIFRNLVIVLAMEMFSAASLFADNLQIPFKSLQARDDSFKLFELRSRLQEAKVKPEERNKLHFAMAEYYLKLNDLTDAQMALEEHVKGVVVDMTTLLANVYLYKLANHRRDQTRAEFLKKEIFDKKFVLLFEKFKQVHYTSLLGNQYDIRYFVDRIEVLLNGDVLEKVSS